MGKLRKLKYFDFIDDYVEELINEELILIGRKKYKPSSILKKIDPTAYHEYYLNCVNAAVEDGHTDGVWHKTAKHRGSELEGQPIFNSYLLWDDAGDFKNKVKEGEE